MGVDSDDNFAEEIVEIFVEEVGEVLGQIDENFPLWQSNAGNEKALKEVRRAFHTLKGSGRMVQAEEIGELAWAVENMLNKVIDSTLKINEFIYELVKEVRAIIPAMLVAFQNKQAAALAGVDFTRMIDQAHAIIEGKKVQSIAHFSRADAEPEKTVPTVSEAFPSLVSTVDMIDVESLKERIGELVTSLDELKRDFLEMSAKVDTTSTKVRDLPKSIDLAAITRQLETADKEIGELKYVIKASSEQMMSEVNSAQKRLSHRVDTELKAVNDHAEQMTAEVALVTSDMRVELIRMIKLWSVGCALGFSVIVLMVSMFVV